MERFYAVKYLDKNGFTVSCGYIATLKSFEPGDIIEDRNQRIKIDFELCSEGGRTHPFAF